MSAPPVAAHFGATQQEPEECLRHTEREIC